ncbi:putative phage abortive infection protein [Psychroserpens damuponensis]|uniref:putative phage abortive infection protein n=1 Tax=Psychroserpens damuponensis TaxID=943936 RepID=UPI00058EF5C9|nr:putative phage abortive infection protein [Psychroserpens damuponensis]
MTKTIQFFAWAFLVLGCIILIVFLNKASIDGYTISNGVPTNYETTGQFGDFIGGVVGTFFALVGTLLIFLTFKEQAKNNKRNAFESSFFEMIRLYRANVNDITYSKTKNNEKNEYQKRQVFRLIYNEFIECYREVKKFSNSSKVSDYITPKYEEKLLEITKRINPNISLIEMAIIDIAYTIVFYGLGTEGESLVRRNFKNKYNTKYYFKLLYYIKLKPKKSNTARSNGWKLIRKMELVKLHPLIDDLYANRETPEKIENLSSALAQELPMDKPYEKYYGGHQFRLGHYYRHLFQSYKYLNEHPDLNQDEKYQYGKMLRAQLSTYEQALIMFNSISALGMKWEFTPEKPKNSDIKTNLITTYNLIKNLPGEHLYGIKYKTYYKDVDYETDEHLM